MSDITIATPEEISANLRFQVRNQIKQEQNIRVSAPQRLSQLQSMIARKDVIAAFGTEMPDVQAAVAAL
jgi:hypothetical protein